MASTYDHIKLSGQLCSDLQNALPASELLKIARALNSLDRPCTLSQYLAHKILECEAAGTL